MTGRGSSTSTATSPGTPLSIYYLHTACVELKSEQIARRGNHQGNALQRFEPALGLANRLWNRRDAPALLARMASSSAVQQKTPYPATRPHDQVSALLGAATPRPNDHMLEGQDGGDQDIPGRGYALAADGGFHRWLQALSGKHAFHPSAHRGHNVWAGLEESLCRHLGQVLLQVVHPFMLHLCARAGYRSILRLGLKTYMGLLCHFASRASVTQNGLWHSYAIGDCH